MGLDLNINIQVIGSVVMAFIGIVALVVTLRMTVAEHGRRLDTVGTRADRIESDLESLRLEVARECVKKNDLQAVEDRLSKRVDTVEHTVRNAQQSILAAITGALRPNARGRSAAE